MTALLSPIVPDLREPYWVVPGISTSRTVMENGVRINLDHQAAVLKARRVLDLSTAGSGQEGKEEMRGNSAAQRRTGPANPATVPPPVAEDASRCGVKHRIDELEYAGCAACAWRTYHDVLERVAKAAGLTWNGNVAALIAALSDPNAAVSDLNPVHPRPAR